MKATIALLLFLAVSLFAAAQDPSPEYDSTLAKQLGADDWGMKSYVLVILKTGPADIQDKELRDSLFRGHFSNMRRLAEEKKLVVSGPLAANEREYRGIFIFDVGTPEEAELLLQGDPTVTAGIFDAEIFRWYGSAALPVYLETVGKISKRDP
jgi:uncharacterized protein YciI